MSRDAKIGGRYRGNVTFDASNYPHRGLVGDQTKYRAEIAAFAERNGYPLTVQKFPCCGALMNVTHNPGCPERYESTSTIKNQGW